MDPLLGERPARSRHRRPGAPPLALRELADRLRLRPGLDLEAGRLRLGWGKTDGYSPAGAFVLRGERGLCDSSDRELGDAALVALGLERGIGDGTFLVTFAANLRREPVAPALLFDRASLPGLIAAWRRPVEWGSYRFAYTHGLDHGDGLVEGEVVRDLDDRWSIELGVDLPRATRSGPLGALREARRVRLTARRRW